MKNSQKEILRKEILEKRRNLAPQFTEEKSRVIEEILVGTKEFSDAERIFSYYSVKGEASTLGIIEKALAFGKTVGLPRVKKDGTMDFFKTESLFSLKKGALGIPEPPEASQRLIPNEKTLIITPGVVFDRHKNRIGMGKGYYDRYFNKYEHIKFKKIGLCFSFQIKEEIPSEAHDIALDKIIWEKGVIE